MTGWNLPPGCTDADIDRALGGDDPRCSECGAETQAEDLEMVWYRGRALYVCHNCPGPPDEPEKERDDAPEFGENP
jgi:DNA-directed RNA polymerase subunit RPC12/RpoP